MSHVAAMATGGMFNFYCTDKNGQSSMSRAISSNFLQTLKTGHLSALTARIRADDTLMLALRGDYIDVYYRGGRILHVVDKTFAATFDANYSEDGTAALPWPTIDTSEKCADAIAVLPQLKEFMNFHLAKKRKSEREFQQLVAWENNRSSIANETEYFITDVEFADAEQGTRIDMLGLKWQSQDRKFNDRCKPVLIEMKYGINAYEGKSGIKSHIKHLQDILKDENKKNALKELIAAQFNQLFDLGLVSFNPNSATRAAIEKAESVTFSASGHPEVVLLLANDNPRSKSLLSILNEIDEPQEFDLRFFNSSFAGYGMHDACMLSLPEFKALLEARIKTKSPASPD